MKPVLINLRDGLNLGGNVSFCMLKAVLKLTTYYMLNIFCYHSEHGFVTGPVSH